MRAAGIEPARSKPEILSLLRLPFRHARNWCPRSRIERTTYPLQGDCSATELRGRLIPLRLPAFQHACPYRTEIPPGPGAAFHAGRVPAIMHLTEQG